jgi:hypothetical protein
MPAHVIEHRGYFILRQFLDEPEQLLTLRGHEPGVRRPSQVSAWLSAARNVSARAGKRWNLGEHGSSSGLTDGPD